MFQAIFLHRKFTIESTIKLSSHTNFETKPLRKTAIRCCSQINLVGRKILRPGEITSHEIKSLLWTAFEIKHHIEHSRSFPLMEGARVTLLMSETNIKQLSVLQDAARAMKLHLNIIIDENWEHELHVEDFGKLLSIHSDILVCSSKTQTKLENLTLRMGKKPVINMRTCRFIIPQALGDLMTFQDYYGYLKNLNLAWIGSPCPVFNTYLCIAPRLGINIRYCASCNKGNSMSPMYLPIGKALSQYMKTMLMEYSDFKEILRLSNVIATSRHTDAQLRMTAKIIGAAVSSRWGLVHCMPRMDEVDDDLFYNVHNLTWRSIENMKWVYCALMLRLLRPYKHITAQPLFDNNPEQVCQI